MSQKMSYDLQRFIKAQEKSYSGALSELQRGKKTGHWIWFIFPQYRGLGRSSTSLYYAVGSLTEAKAYLADERLGSRLLECTHALLKLEGRSAKEIFGYPDLLKVRSSMTLFDQVSPSGNPFARALTKYYQDLPDRKTLELIAQECTNTE